MRSPSARLILRSPLASPASARHCLATGRGDVLSLSAQQPSPGATNFVLWLQTIDTAGAQWGCRALWGGDSRCTAVLHPAERLPLYSVPALLDALPSLDTVFLPVLCLALCTPPTATLFLCRSFRHARALKAALQFDLDFGAPLSSQLLIMASGDLHCYRSGITADTLVPNGPSA
eukprot:3530589-Rhodomonas_salina.2